VLLQDGVATLVSYLEFNVPFQHKYGYIRDERCDVLRSRTFCQATGVCCDEKVDMIDSALLFAFSAKLRALPLPSRSVALHGNLEGCG